MSDTITITLPWPERVLFPHAKGHWRPRHKATMKARTDAFWAGKDANLPCWPNAWIGIEYYPQTRRGDPHNVPGALKAYIDGIADAMGCDDKHFKVDFPREFAGTNMPPKVVFRISEGGG